MCPYIQKIKLACRTSKAEFRYVAVLGCDFRGQDKI